MLAGTLGADHLTVLEHIHPLTGINAVPIRGGERIGQFILTAKAVAAVLRLPIDCIACNADGICLLLDQRHIVAARTVSCGHGRRYLVRTGVAAVDAVVFIYERLVSMLLRPQRAGYIFTAIHHAAALVVETQNGRHHVRAAFRCFQRRRAFFLIPDTTGLAALTSGEGSSQHTGVTLSCLPTSGSQCRVPVLGKEAIPIAFGHNA